MKTSNKDIKQLVKYGYAVDITTGDINHIKELENGFNKIAYSIGSYGRNGLLLQGRNTKTLYAITSRSTNIFYIA